MSGDRLRVMEELHDLFWEHGYSNTVQGVKILDNGHGIYTLLDVWIGKRGPVLVERFFTGGRPSGFDVFIQASQSLRVDSTLEAVRQHIAGEQHTAD